MRERDWWLAWMVFLGAFLLGYASGFWYFVINLQLPVGQ